MIDSYVKLSVASWGKINVWVSTMHQNLLFVHYSKALSQWSFALKLPNKIILNFKSHRNKIRGFLLRDQQLKIGNMELWLLLSINMQTFECATMCIKLRLKNIFHKFISL